MEVIPKRLWLTGIITGLVSGMLGVGGGLVLGPALILLGMPLRRATGTALVLIPFIALVAVIAELIIAPHNLDLMLATVIFIGGSFGVKIGSHLERHLNDKLLHYLFIALVLVSALRNIYSGLSPIEVLATTSSFEILPQYFLYAASFGVVAGICAILFGVGGGVIVVPALIITLEGMTFQSASAISLLAMVPTALLAARSAHQQQRVDLRLAKDLSWVCLPAAAVGVALRNFSFSHHQLELCFAGFLIYVALRMLQRGSCP
ncbi:MAG: putative membrane protein YfcA [Myxococcota bacterium]